MKETIGIAEKEILAIKEIFEDSPMVALLFQEKTRAGVFLGTKTKSRNMKFFPIAVPVEEELYDEEEEKTRSERLMIIGGVGNYAEFRRLLQKFSEIIRDEVSTYGIHPHSSEAVVGRFSEFLNEEFRSADSISPYRVEILIISLLENSLQMFRMKSDGDYHPAEPLCIIGGYTPAGRGTLRKKALAMLKKLYAKKVPTLKICQRITKRILKMDKNPGEPQGFVLALELSQPKTV